MGEVLEYRARQPTVNIYSTIFDRTGWTISSLHRYTETTCCRSCISIVLYNWGQQQEIDWQCFCIPAYLLQYFFLFLCRKMYALWYTISSTKWIAHQDKLCIVLKQSFKANLSENVPITGNAHSNFMNSNIYYVMKSKSVPLYLYS